MKTFLHPAGTGGFELKICERLGFPARTFLHVSLIAFLAFLAYSNTFKNPFQWDDTYYIKQNPAIKDFSYFLDPSRAEGLDFYGAIKSRYMGYLSFAVNYNLHGLDVTGYHIFNLILHILNSLLVYLLVANIFKTPFFSGYSLREHSGYIAFFTGLLFAVHPVQTEAVTYIFQRLASLTAFFYLCSVVCYLIWRIGREKGEVPAREHFFFFFSFWRANALYILSLVSAITAMKTKENAFTLPIVIGLMELLFFTGPLKRRLMHLVPFAVTMLIVPLTLIGIDKPVGEIIGSIDPATRGYSDISREDYLLTELRVVTTYIRLLFLPLNQNLDYDYPVYHSFFAPEVLLSFLFMLSILGLALVFYYRSRFINPSTRLVAFGILWFFITISIESSMIPLPTLIDEYRLYLPSAGFFLATMTGAFLFIGGIKSRAIQKGFVWLVIMVPLAYSIATYERNEVWQSRVSLWEDVVRKSPHKAGPHNNLGNAYFSVGQSDKAIEQYKTALSIDPDFAEAHFNLGVAFEFRGLHKNAAMHYLEALSLRPDYEKAHFNLGILDMDAGNPDEARKHLETALSLNPARTEARKFLDYIEMNTVKK